MKGARRLKPARIEARATVLLLEYQGQFGVIRRPPVPVDEILENFLKLHLEFDDLRNRGFAGVHAMTDTGAKKVIVDERLDPVEQPAMEGRYNFTLAHEIGHIGLRHPPIHTLEFPTEDPDPRLVGSYREYEWQADKFASYLLMPRSLVIQEWRARFGNEQPLQITPEMETAAADVGFTRAELVKGFAEEHAQEFASMFKVSVDAMRIRLQELNLLPK